MIRLQLPARRALPDARPLLTMPRFGLSVTTVSPTETTTRTVIAEFMRPRKIAKDVLTVQCTVDNVVFELMRVQVAELQVVVCRAEKTPAEMVVAMRALPPIARALLVFDHRARSGVPEAVAMVGLINALAPAANMRNMGQIVEPVRDADLAMLNAFDAVERWMEDGHG